MQYANMAQQVRARGRGDDTMLIHMTPKEVGGLQTLALATGGSLTVNPDTGLPEAGWLGDMLPTILGVVGAAFGLPTWAVGLGGMAAGTAATGDLSKGLMAGLGAFGGASLAGAAGISGAAGNLFGGAANAGAATGAASAGAAAGTDAATQLATQAASAAPAATAGGLNVLAPSAEALTASATQAIPAVTGSVAKGGLGGFMSRFGDAARAGLPAGTPGIIQKAAPMAAGLGVLSGVNNALTPSMPKMPEEENKFPYAGPYSMNPRTPVYPGQQAAAPAPLDPAKTRDSSEFNYFPEPVSFKDAQGKPYTPGMMGAGVPAKVDPVKKKKKGLFAAGGEVCMGQHPMQGMMNPNAAVNQMPTVTQAAGIPSPVLGGGTANNPNGEPTRGAYPSAPIPGGGVANNPNGAPLTSGMPNPALNPMQAVPVGSNNGNNPNGRGQGQIRGLPGLAEGGTVSSTPAPAVFADMPAATSAPAPSPFQGRPTFEALLAQFQPQAQGPNPMLAALAATQAQRTPGAAPTSAPGATARPQGEAQHFAGRTSAPPAPTNPFANLLNGLGYAAPGMPPPPASPGMQVVDLGNGQYYEMPAEHSWSSATPQAAPQQSLPTPQPLTAMPYSGDPSQLGYDPSTFDWSSYNFGTGFAAGGAVSLDDGSFVVDARTVSELGNGSSSAGQDILAQLGGMPVRGGGDGVSDSVPASIAGRQPARVARDEVVFDPQAITRLGGGNHERGTNKLYALMDRAHKARKKAKPGENTGLAQGLGGL